MSLLLKNMPQSVSVFHLLNDYSGSPKVLRTVLDNMHRRGIKINLHTSRGGVLDELAAHPGVTIHHFNYKFGGAGTLPRFIRAQIRMFAASWRYISSRNVFYINTLLPIGAAIGGRLTGKRVVYHYHENADAKGALYRILARAMQMLASDIICVSEYQRSFLQRSKNVFVVPNAVPDEFIAKLTPNPEKAFLRKQILMLGSLKEYKGTREFILLAQHMPEYSFELVLNEEQENIESYIERNCVRIPDNLKVYSRQKDVSPFYNSASIVLNLSNKSLFIETFGLTALEGMSAGLPVIVPTVGGIAEMVENDRNGYKIDVQELERIESAIRRVLTDRELYLHLADGALQTSRRYSQAASNEAIYKILTNRNPRRYRTPRLRHGS